MAVGDDQADFATPCYIALKPAIFWECKLQRECIYTRYIRARHLAEKHREGTQFYSLMCLLHLYAGMIETQKEDKYILMQVFAALFLNISKVGKKQKQIKMTCRVSAELDNRN